MSSIHTHKSHRNQKETHPRKVIFRAIGIIGCGDFMRVGAKAKKVTPAQDGPRRTVFLHAARSTIHKSL